MSARIKNLLLLLVYVGVAAFVVSFVREFRGAPEEGRRVDGEVVELPTQGRPRVRVEVLNGAGRAGIAREATRRLRDGGFDVVYFGNADEFDQEVSVVLDRAGDLGPAGAVARTLGIETVASAPDSTLLLEVTVLLGEDWAPAGAARAAGWRSWLRRIGGWLAP